MSHDPARLAIINSALAAPHGGTAIAIILGDARLQWTSEDDLQRGIQEFLSAYGIPDVVREVTLSDRRSRIDLRAGGVGIEVKIEGSWADVIRQLTRYAKCPEIVSLVLVTTRAKHHHVPEQLCGKPISLVSLVGVGL